MKQKVHDQGQILWTSKWSTFEAKASSKMLILWYWSYKYELNHWKATLEIKKVYVSVVNISHDQLCQTRQNDLAR